MHDILTAAEAADMLGVTPGRVRALISSGTLPARRIGNSWALPRGPVLARTYRTVKAGRPLSAAAAWESILSGIADINDAARYENRGRPVRFHSQGNIAVRAAAALGGLLSGTLAAQQHLEPASWDMAVGIPEADDQQDVYLPESAAEDLIQFVAWPPDGFGRAVVRIVPDSLWGGVMATSSPPAAPDSLRLAPPLAVALDLWHHTGARSYDAAVTLAAVYGRADDDA